MRSIVDKMDPITVRATGTRLFPEGPKGAPVVMEYGNGWDLDQLHVKLLRSLAHLITAKQFPSFRSHATIGYVEDPSGEQRSQLLDILDVEESTTWTAAEVVVTIGDAGAERLEFGMRQDGKK